MALICHRGGWDPVRELMDVTQELEQWCGVRSPGVPTRRWAAEGVWAPATDIEETKEQFVVKADLPGMKQEEISISVLGNTLTISGERKSAAETKEDDGRFLRMERVCGSFQRVVELPSSVNVDQVKASYRDGLLTVTVPKREEAKPKQIQVEVN